MRRISQYLAAGVYEIPVPASAIQDGQAKYVSINPSHELNQEQDFIDFLRGEQDDPRN